MLRQGTKRLSEKGVTMIELAVVMAIIGIIALFMIPSIGEWTPGFRLRGASKELADTLQVARMKAISTGTPYRVQLNINNGSGAETFKLQNDPDDDPDVGWLDEGVPVTLPKGVNIDNIDATDAGSITRTFRTNGTAFGWTAGNATSIIYLENERNEQYRVVISQTGMVRTRDGW